MSSKPYANKPESISEASQWHELSFQISIDQPVNWDDFDLRKWGHTVAAYTARVMASTTIDPDIPDDELDEIKTLLMGLTVKRITFVTDGTLHTLIDEFEDE